LILWGELSHCLTEDLIRKNAVVVTTSTMVVSSRFQGIFYF
jgi:hypothetical protein